MTNHYKCGNHTLQLICPGCVNAWIWRHNRMLEFIKNIAWLNKYTDEEIQQLNNMGYYYDAKEARTLLREIGKIK